MGLLPDGSDSVGKGETVVVSGTVVYTEVVNVLVKPAMYIAVLGIRYHAHMHISYQVKEI